MVKKLLSCDGGRTPALTVKPTGLFHAGLEKSLGNLPFLERVSSALSGIRKREIPDA